MIEMDNRPGAIPRKLAYLWRDLHRRAEMYGFAFEGEAPYPLRNFDLANRVAIVGAQEGWCADYVRATYRRWFVEDQECGMEPNLSDSLREIGEDPRRVIPLAQSEEIARAYDGATEQARRLGIWGADLRRARRGVLGRRPARRCRHLASARHIGCAAAAVVAVTLRSERSEPRRVTAFAAAWASLRKHFGGHHRVRPKMRPVSSRRCIDCNFLSRRAFG